MKPFEVLGITKYQNGDLPLEFILIDVLACEGTEHRAEDITLPSFPIGTCFQELERYRTYEVEELCEMLKE